MRLGTGFDSLWSVDVVRVQFLVLFLLLFRKLFPILFLVCSERLPLLANGLAQVGLAGLLACGGSGGGLGSAFAAKENEGVLRSLDIVVIASLRPAVYVGGFSTLGRRRGG